MLPDAPRQWLLLIHQIPPKPDALRVRIWRRLQQVGAVAVKPSVYALPLTGASREDLSWILREIVAGGGDGSISQARFVEGLADAQLLALFHKARRADYRKLIADAKCLAAEWHSASGGRCSPPLKGPAQLNRLQRRLEEIAAIDFFATPERSAAEVHLKELGDLLAGQPPPASPPGEGRSELAGMIWVTRSDIHVDRMACGWLIRLFVDQGAVFKFVSEPRYAPQAGELRFDMFAGEYTHEGDRCTFEVMLHRLRLQDRALAPMAEVVHDIDLKDHKFGRSETDGFNALLTGLAAAHPADERRMTAGCHCFDNLYAYYRLGMHAESAEK
jgi:hypothetical protein